MPTQVWEDPYAEGVRREETDRDSTGVRLQWDRILGTAFELTSPTGRLDRHRAQRRGRYERRLRCSLPGPAAARRRPVPLRSSYLFRLGEGQRHLVRPMVRYTVDDRDGEAISGDATGCS